MTSFLSTDCELSTETCSKTFIVMALGILIMTFQYFLCFEDAYEPCVVPRWVDVYDDLLVASFARGATPRRRVRLLLGACGTTVDATLYDHLDLVFAPGPELRLEVGGHVLSRQLTWVGRGEGLGVIQNCQNYQKSTFL